ncbi:heme biosynthesis protein HemY [Ancylobacter sp. MQZ15Z-1]|uniref:Heme biosynthesis protein HemY n=1 Tax=Ancylobacter mangrovi TaxID=2972472 RepID=A0A9X2PLR0_9HYPH|nr:heme biosynthesis HemY N-terminal domain-containing protein [Ancylobacter mangrovi]MCS0497402.1 heme biosynthesis protein HemY [Ancylobacter mangrovi]
MIRLVVYLLILAGIAFGVAWLADRPGTIAMDWQGWHIETSVLVAASGLLVLVAAVILLWSLLRLIVRSPDMIAGSYRQRRRNRGWAAISRGLVAVGSGDTLGAKRAANDAQRLLGQEPLTHLLTAQAAQLSGDAAGAEATFRAMTETTSTRMLGLRGLHVEARRRGDANAALMAAEEAARYEPGLAWAADAVIEARCHAGDFAGALAVLEREAAHGGLDRAAHRRRRAVLLAAQAQALELADPAVAREKAVEATRLAPTLVPAAEAAGRLLGANGDTRKAAKVLETAYAATPHPDLADAYLHLRPGDSSRERLKRMRTLTARMPAHAESALALARAALDAQEFDVARTSLGPLLGEPSQRTCLLMAELEAAENGDVGKAREWTARAVRAPRDPAWVADGVVAENWGPVSPVTGKLDAFEWRLPPGVAATPLLENEADRVKAAIAAALESRAAKEIKNEVESAAADAAAFDPAPLKTPPAADPVPKPIDTPAPVPSPAAAHRSVPLAQPVVAAPHLPDDPGPGPFPEDETSEKRATFGV